MEKDLHPSIVCGPIFLFNKRTGKSRWGIIILNSVSYLIYWH